MAWWLTAAVVVLVLAAAAVWALWRRRSPDRPDPWRDDEAYTEWLRQIGARTQPPAGEDERQRWSHPMPPGGPAARPESSPQRRPDGRSEPGPR